MDKKKRIDEYLKQGSWKGEDSLFNFKEDNLEVSILISTGEVIKGVWHYDKKHLETQDNINIVAWKKTKEFTKLPTLFQRIFRKTK